VSAATDVVPARLEVARCYGAEAVIDSAEDLAASATAIGPATPVQVRLLY
jgi:threonine dehydrogenase-like Zn-dependent dehydrogenase